MARGPLASTNGFLRLTLQLVGGGLNKLEPEMEIIAGGKTLCAERVKTG